MVLNFEKNKKINLSRFSPYLERLGELDELQAIEFNFAEANIKNELLEAISEYLENTKSPLTKLVINIS